MSFNPLTRTMPLPQSRTGNSTQPAPVQQRSWLGRRFSRGNNQVAPRIPSPIASTPFPSSPVPQGRGYRHVFSRGRSQVAPRVPSPIAVNTSPFSPVPLGRVYGPVFSGGHSQAAPMRVSSPSYTSPFSPVPQGRVYGPAFDRGDHLFFPLVSSPNYTSPSSPVPQGSGYSPSSEEGLYLSFPHVPNPFPSSPAQIQWQRFGNEEEGYCLLGVSVRSDGAYLYKNPMENDSSFDSSSYSYQTPSPLRPSDYPPEWRRVLDRSPDNL